MAASSSCGDADTPFWLLLRGDDVSEPTHGRVPRSRIVLLHGWLQAHASWMRTAAALRDRYGHDVLLLDFYAHGHTRAPSPDVMSPKAWTDLLCDRLQAVGWDHGQQIVLSGASLGAAVAMRYACAHPDRVARLNLIAPAGLPEPFYMPCHTLWEFPRAICALLPKSTWLNLLYVTLETPEYGVDIEEVLKLTKGGLRLTVFAAGCDFVHSSHHAFWRGAADGSAGRIRFTYLPGRTHWGVCAGLYELGLHREEAMWHDRATEDQQHPRSRL